MAELKREFIGGIGEPVIKEIVNNLENMDMNFKVKKSHIHDWKDYMYRLFVEFEEKDGVRQVKALVIEVEDEKIFNHTF